jgi:dolichol kinase
VAERRPAEKPSAALGAAGKWTPAVHVETHAELSRRLDDNLTIPLVSAATAGLMLLSLSRP